MAARTYVYRIFDGFETVYVGKGSGRRIRQQAARFKCQGEIIQHCTTDEEAFKAERKWISELKPTANRHPGGQGGRVKPKHDPHAASWRKFLKEYNEVGPRRYAARFLARKLNEANCEKWGVSKIDVFRIHEVANGPWC